MCTTPLYCTSALYTFSHTVSTNHKSLVGEDHYGKEEPEWELMLDVDALAKDEVGWCKLDPGLKATGFKL